MHTSVPNFNFLARLVSEIWRGSQNKKWQLLIFPDPLSDKFLHEAIVPANAYQRTKFQLPSSNSFQDKEGVPKLNVGLLRPCRTPYAETFTYAPSTWQGKTASQMSVSYLYASRSYANMYFP